MTTYVAITNAEIDQDSPVTQPLMTALRDNLLAVIEGDVTAPKINGTALQNGTVNGAKLNVAARSFSGTLSAGASINLNQSDPYAFNPSVFSAASANMTATVVALVGVFQWRINNPDGTPRSYSFGWNYIVV